MSSDHLHLLVHNLNQAEKRYFKLFMKRYSQKNDSSNFAQFFDYLVKNKTYERSEVLKKCSFIKPKQLQNVKNRLYRYILMALRAYNANTTSSSKIELYQIMINYEILVSKGLFLQAWNVLIKAEKIAEAYEFNNMLCDILEQKRYLATSRLKSKQVKIELTAIKEKQEKLTSLCNYIRGLIKIFDIEYDIFKVEGRVLRDKTLILNLKNQLLLYSENLTKFAYSRQAVFYYYCNFRLYYALLGEWQKAQEYTQKLLELFNDFYTLEISTFAIYRKIYVSNIIVLNVLQKYDEAKVEIDAIRTIPKIISNNKEVELAVFEDSFFFELESYISSSNFNQAIQLIESNTKQIALFEKQMHNVNQQSKRYRIALSYFGANQFEEALEWINRIIFLDKLKYRRDILASVQLLNLLIHLELKNYILVKNKIKSITSYLTKINRWLPPEQELIQVIHKIASLSPTSPEHLFLALKEKLMELFEINPLDAYFFCYFDITKWLEQKSNGLN